MILLGDICLMYELNVWQAQFCFRQSLLQGSINQMGKLC